MRCIIALVFLLLSTQILGAEFKLSSFSSMEDFNNSKFTWTQLRDCTEKYIKTIYGEKYVHEKDDLLDASFVHNYESLKAGKSILVLMTLGEELRGSLMFFKDPKEPYIIQIVSLDIEGYCKMIGEIFIKTPEARCLKVIIAKDNPLVLALQEQPVPEIIQEVALPENACQEILRDKVLCLSSPIECVPIFLKKLAGLFAELAKKQNESAASIQ